MVLSPARRYVRLGDNRKAVRATGMASSLNLLAYEQLPGRGRIFLSIENSRSAGILRVVPALAATPSPNKT